MKDDTKWFVFGLEAAEMIQSLTLDCGKANKARTVDWQVEARSGRNPNVFNLIVSPWLTWFASPNEAHHFGKKSMFE